jgi:hypothetical protein
LPHNLRAPSSCPRAPGTFSSARDGLAKPVRAQGSHPRIDGPCCQKGRAPHAPKEGITLTPTLPPFWPPPYRKSTGGNAMSCHSWGRTTRTHRVRPSGKTSLASRAFLGKAIRAGLAPRGGAGSARPQGWLGPNRHMSPQGPRVIFDACGGNEMPGVASGPYLRTHRVRPSEKTASRVVSGPSSVGPSVVGLPPWRGGLRTPARMAWA